MRRHFGTVYLNQNSMGKLLYLPGDQKQPSGNQLVTLDDLYVPKIMWITASLFLLLCIASIGWGVTSASLKVYVADDVKYRKLELTRDSASLVYLWCLDSLYTANPDSLQNYVTEQERLKRQREELLDRVQLLEKRIDTSAGKLGSPKDN
jgi:hypothetical protein